MSPVTGKKRPLDIDLETRLEKAGSERRRARVRAELADESLREVVLEALAQGASVRVVAEVAGLAPVTVAKWKRPSS